MSWAVRSPASTFHFDADGKLIRRIERFISNKATNSIRVVWKEWEIGSGVSADALLDSAKDERTAAQLSGLRQTAREQSSRPHRRASIDPRIKGPTGVTLR